MPVRGRRVLIGVSGGIAAYKTAEVVSSLVKAGAEVQVMMTEAATKLVAPLTFQALSQNPVYTTLLAEPKRYNVEHVALAQWAEAALIAPASANFLARLAAGMADDIVTAVLLAADCPVLLAPAMNPAMWRKPSVQENIARLTGWGYRVVAPGSGRVACGDTGVGRMAEPAELIARLEALFTGEAPLRGRHVVITAGPTREHLDPVRFLSNPSTGKMGYALAAAARDLGARVTLVTGPTYLAHPVGVEVVPVVSAAEMHAAVMARAGDAAVFIGAAAVADFRPKRQEGAKVPKAEAATSVELEPTRDILAELGAAKRPGQVLVGFAAETGDLGAKVPAKLRRKQCDLCVGNDVTKAGAGFGHDTNEVVLYYADGREEAVPMQDKGAVAALIMQRAAALLAARA